MELDKLRTIIAEVLCVDPKEITEETTFVDDLCADSLDAVSYTHLTLPTTERV